MKKSFIMILGLCMMLVMLLSACASSAAETPAQDALPAEAPVEVSEEATAETAEEETAVDRPVELVVGGVSAGSAKDAVTFFAEKVAEYSNGTIIILDFPDSILGSDEQRFEMARSGECDISIGVTASVASVYNDFYIYDVPYLFLDKAEVYNVGFGGEAGQAILSGLESLGLKGLAMWDNGFRHLITNDKEISTLADLQGLTIRTIDNPLHSAVWQVLGAEPVPLPFAELHKAMGDGTVAAAENTLGVITGSGFPDTGHFCYLTGHIYSPYYVVMNLVKWNSLSTEQQDAVSRAMTETVAYQYAQAQQYENEAAAIMEAAGCRVITLDEITRTAYSIAADSANGLEMARELMANPDLADLMISELEAGRK